MAKEDGPLALSQLTARQLQVLHLISRGYSSKAAGRELNISPKTVDRYIDLINERLGSENRAAAIRIYQDRILGNGNMGAISIGEKFPLGIETVAHPPSELPTQPQEEATPSDQKPPWWALPAVSGERTNRSLTSTGFGILKASAVGLIMLLSLLLMATGLMHYFR